MTVPGTRRPGRVDRAAMVGAGIVLVVGGIASGFYAVFIWFSVHQGVGSVSGEEFLLWLPALISAASVAGGAFLIAKGWRQ
jgi:hypothetical protein